MAKLYFKIASDWEEVVRLRNEIAKLKQELKGMDSTQSPAAFKSLNTQLSASTQRMDELVTKAAQAGAVMEGDFRKKIFDASQTVNGFTEKIIAQKNTIKSFEQDLRRVQEAWSNAVKNGQSTKGLENPIRLKKVILEEKDALFNLTQEQANARLSVKKLRDEYALYKNDGKNVVATNEAMAISWKKALGVIGGVAALKQLGSEIIRVRGEFQSMQTAIETMVGKDMAGQLIPQIKELAKISPLTMSDMVGAEKMMLGFNIQAEDTIKYLKAISDISMGESGKFNSLTLAFSQMSAAGKLMGQDLNQMINAGFNPLQVIAEKTGKSIAALKGEMSKGAISAEMVQQAFIDATSAGGKFYGMSENASKTINGQISMMQDAWDNALNEIGKSSEGFIMSGIQATTSLIQNYETVGKVLVGLIATYGAYRTALVLNIALEKAQAVQHLASIKGITTMKMLTDMLTASVTKLNVALAGKGFAMIAGAAVASSLLLLNWANEQDKCTKAVEKFNKEQNAASEAEKRRAQIVKNAISVASDEKRTTDERINAIGVLKQMYKDIIPEYEKEIFLLKNKVDYKNKINEAEARNKRIDVKTKIVMLDKDIAKYEAGLREANKQGAGQATQGIMNTLNNLKKERELYSNLLNDIEKERITTKTDSKSEIKNKSYWEKQKKDAESVLESLASSQRQLMDAGVFKGIDAATVKSYKDNVRLLKEAEKELEVYNSSTKQNNEAKKLRQQQQKSSEELLALRRQNQQDEIDLMEEGTDKRLKQIDLDYQKELDVIRKKEQEWSKANGGKLTEEQSVQISLAYSQAEGNRDKSISEMNQEEFDAMNRYLKEYGTFQQRKDAITKEYSDKIAQAATEGDKKILQKEMEESLSSLNMDKLKQSMDWEQVFGDLDKISTDTLKKLKANLKDFISAQKDLSPENLKELVDAIERIDDKVSERNPFESMAASFKSLRAATDAQREAQEAYNKALKEGTDKEKKNAEATLESAKNNKRKALVEATAALHKGVDEIGQYVDAGNQIVGIMETLGVKTPEWMGGYMEGVGEMLNGLSNIDLTKPMSIVTGGLQTIKGALTSIISLGGLIPGLSGADYSGYENMKSQYENLISIWDELIDKKMQYIDIDYGKEAMKAAKEAEDATNIQIKRQRQLIKELASSGASKGSHSLGYRIDHRLSKEDYQRLSALAGQKITAEYQLWDLSPEQIEKILSDEKLVSVLDTVNKDFVTYLQNIVDYGEKLDEITERTKEAVTGISFDEFRSGYAGLLSDLDSTNEDFADNFEKYLQQAIFESLLANEYKDQIQELYDTWAEYGKDGLDSDEARTLREMQQKLTNDLLAKRDELMNDFGWESESESTSQSSTSKGFQSMSQETGEELNGRFTALQIAGEEIKNQNIIQSQSLNLLTAKADTILSMNTEVKNIADETRTILANSYLELMQISENTGNSAKYLKDIKADISEVKKNTSKL